MKTILLITFIANSVQANAQNELFGLPLKYDRIYYSGIVPVQADSLELKERARAWVLETFKTYDVIKYESGNELQISPEIGFVLMGSRVMSSEFVNLHVNIILSLKNEKYKYEFNSFEVSGEAYPQRMPFEVILRSKFNKYDLPQTADILSQTIEAYLQSLKITIGKSQQW